MHYQEIYEAAKYYADHKCLHQQDGFYINNLYASACNYLMYSDFNDHYFTIYFLVEGIYHEYHDRLIKENPDKIPLFKGASKTLLKVYHHVTDSKKNIETIDQQLLIAVCINMERVKHSGAQFSSAEVGNSNLKEYEEQLNIVKTKLPIIIEAKSALLALKRMNRFQIITDYLIAKFDLKYPPRIPRLDDFCKLIHSLDQECSQVSLSRYFDRMDTAKFDKVSVYSTWNVCYYKNIRDQISMLPEATLEKQFTSFKNQLYDHHKKAKEGSSAATVYRSLIVNLSF